jgi:hypothetical protein
MAVSERLQIQEPVFHHNRIFIESCQFGTDASTFSGIMLKNNGISIE